MLAGRGSREKRDRSWAYPGAELDQIEKRNFKLHRKTKKVCKNLAHTVRGVRWELRTSGGKNV